MGIGMPGGLCYETNGAVNGGKIPQWPTLDVALVIGPAVVPHTQDRLPHSSASLESTTKNMLSARKLSPISTLAVHLPATVADPILAMKRR